MSTDAVCNKRPQKVHLFEIGNKYKIHVGFLIVTNLMSSTLELSVP